MLTKQIDFKQIARQTDILALIGNDTKWTSRASTNGGEYKGACPFCGGDDRFAVQPAKGKWFCSECTGRTFTNDAIDYVARRDNLTPYEAAMRLAGNVTLSPLTPIVAETAVSATIAPPSQEWQALAMTAIQESCERLFDGSRESYLVLKYLTEYRGLTLETIRKASLGYNPKSYYIGGHWLPEGITIPCMVGSEIWYLKVRSTKHQYEKTGQKYMMFGGSTGKALYNANQLATAQHGIITEGEFDALLLSQFVGDEIAVGTMGSKGSTPYNPYWKIYLNGLHSLKVALDNDAQKEMDKWRELFPFAEMMPEIPSGANDITDLWRLDKSGDMLRSWLND